MNFKFLFKENLIDQRLMQRSWEENPWSPAATTTGDQTEAITAPVETERAVETQAGNGGTEVTNPFTFNGQAVDFTYNDNLSARQNRKLLKKKLKGLGGDKADATGLISEYWAQRGGASGADKKWLEARAGQYGYTTDQNGNRDYHRTGNNWGKVLATIGGTLLGGPTGGAAAYMWAKQKNQVPGLKKGFFDPTSVVKTNPASTAPVTENPVTEAPVAENPVTENPVTPTSYSFSGFTGPWGSHIQDVYNANQQNEHWGKMDTNQDGTITQDEFSAYQGLLGQTADGKLGRKTLNALGLSSQQNDYSWMQLRDQGGDNIKTSMDDVVITPTSHHDPKTARLLADATKYGYTGNSYELDGKKYITADDYNNWLSKQTAFDQKWIKAGATRVPIKGQAGQFAYKDKDGRIWYSNGVSQQNGLTYHTTGAITGANPGMGKHVAEGYSAQQKLIRQNPNLRVSNAMGTDKHAYQVGDKIYPMVVTTGLGTDNRHNDRTFYYDESTGLYTPAEEANSGGAKGFMPTESGRLNWYTWDQIAGNQVFSGTDYDKYKQGGVLRFQQGGQLDDQDKMLLASTLGMIGYAASQGKQIQIEEAAAQVASLAQTQPESLQELASNKELVNAGVQAVGQETVQKLSQPGVMKQLLSQVSKMPKAMNGTKLNYIKELKGICPDGYEMQYFAAGGHLCQRCMKNKKIEEAKCGKKMKKHGDGDKVTPNNGTVSPHVQKVKRDIQDSLGKKKDDKNWRGPVPTTPRANTAPSEQNKSRKRLIPPHPVTHRANIEIKSKK